MLIVAFLPKEHGPAVVAALLVFRVIYYWLPLLIAAAMLGRNEWRLSSKRQLGELRKQAYTMTWQLEKLIQEHEAKLRAPDKEAVTKAIEQTRAEAKGDNVETLKAAIHRLERALHALSRTLYATADAPAEATAGDGAAHRPNGRPGGTAPGGREEDAIEAEFEVK